MRRNLFLIFWGICFSLFCFAGIARADNYKKVIAWDVDGVIVDSARETYIVSMESLKRHEEEIKTTFGNPVKEYSYEEFYKDRPFVKKAYEFFLHAFSRSFIGKSADQLSEKDRREFYTKYKSLIEKLTETFYSIRKEFQNENINSWYDLNPVYPGIPEAMKHLKEMGFEFVVMSSKDKVSIWSLFTRHGIQKYFDESMIFDNTTGKDRREQMENIQKKVGSDNEFVIIDDLPDQLAINRAAMKDKKVQYIGAKWGYGMGWDKYPFVHLVEKPELLPKIIGELSK